MSRRAARSPDELAKLRAAPGYVGPPPGPPRLVGARAHGDRRETGLMILRRTGRIDARQLRAGERYGRLWRDAGVEGEAAIRSSMSLLDSPGGGGGAAIPGALIEAEVVLAARRDLVAARAALGFEEHMVAACDVVCGKQWAIGQVTEIRRESEAISTLLYVALNLLDAHFAG